MCEYILHYLQCYAFPFVAQFPGNPSLCDVCNGSAFDKDKALIIKGKYKKNIVRGL